MRHDLETIQNWIKPDSRVLDLGCGNGTLLAMLKDSKNVRGYGIEINEALIIECIKKRVNVIEQNLDGDLGNFQTQSFDTVVMTQALQAVKYPDKVIDDMLRIGKECVITFPNFGHWRCRLYLALKGRMPVSKILPYTWYNTPNIHLCTFRDFEALCHRKSLTILNRMVVDSNDNHNPLIRWFPNLFGETAIYHVTR
ncbi:MAG: methionine biosynthesis protein MetW [Gammaproteobacteria bacterium]|nr:MAG: methionine biosynthesis protein MetW [Gammaproteobacteria bacterium]